MVDPLRPHFHQSLEVATPVLRESLRDLWVGYGEDFRGEKRGVGAVVEADCADGDAAGQLDDGEDGVKVELSRDRDADDRLDCY